MRGERLVEGDAGVDGAGVVVDASGEGLDVIEALVAEPHGDGEGAGSVVAEDDVGEVRVELGVGAGGHLAHGDEGGTGDGGGGGFPGFADVEEGRWRRRCGLVAEEPHQSFGGDFGVYHEVKTKWFGGRM